MAGFTEKEIMSGEVKVKNGMIIRTRRGVEHRLHNTIPKKCDNCGFPAMEIISKDFDREIITLGCPMCSAYREMCMICGKMAYSLDKHSHNKKP